MRRRKQAVTAQKKREKDSYVADAVLGMSLEQLANEILLDLFENCSVIDLLCMFHGLNTRFNTMFPNSSHSYHLNLRFTSTGNFDIICRKCLLLLVDCTHSLRLSESDETPMRIHSFVSRFHLEHFTCWRALALDHLHSLRTIRIVFGQCHQLIHRIVLLWFGRSCSFVWTYTASLLST